MKKNIFFRPLALLAALCLASTLLPPAYAFSPLPSRSQTHTVDGGYGTTEEKLRNLINSDAVQDGDTIVLNGSCLVNDLASKSAPWCITKSVTIQGGTLQLRAGGIVLGADVTFQDIELSFENNVRNAIMANGYTLTLNNVSRSSGSREVHALCGGLTGDVNTYDPIPQPGAHGKIVVDGTTTVGNLYAGSLSGAGQDNEFTGSAEIVVNTGINYKIKNIYACGALETYVPDNWFDQEEPAPPAPSPERFRVSGPVTLRLNASVSSVDGRTGTDGNVPDVIYTDPKNSLNEYVTFQSIGSLTVERGNLKPAQGSSFYSANSNITIKNGAALNLANYIPDLTIQNFTGGGSLILAPDQTLSIQGSVANSTIFGVGNIFNDTSNALTDGHTYIQAPQSGEASFALPAGSSSAPVQLVRNPNGDWVGASASGGDPAPVIVGSFQLPPQVAVSAQETEAAIPITVTYAANSAPVSYLNFVPLTVRLDGKDLNRQEDDGVYYYTSPSGFRFEASLDDDGAESFYFTTIDSSPLFADTYKFDITIPKEYTAGNSPLSASTTLIITDDSTITPPPLTVDSIAVSSTAHKTVYQTGEALDVTGLTILVSMSDGSSQTVPVMADMVSGFDSAAAVERQTLTITYQGQTTTYTISIQDASLPPVETETYRVSIQDSYASASGAGLYGKDELVNIHAGSRSGYIFAGWTASGVTLQNPSQADTSFRMPEHDVSLTARWSVYTPPSGGGNGGSSGGSSGGGSSSGGSSGGSSSSSSSSSYTPPQTPAQQTVSKLYSARPGSTVAMNLPSGKAVVEANVLKTLAGRPITLSIQTGDSIWTIRGRDVPKGTSFDKLDLSVDPTSGAVPDAVVREIAGTSRTAQFSLAHSGAFGFDAQLSMKTDRQNIGLWANLYYYNPSRRALEFQHASRVDSTGRMAFPFQHASAYVVVFDKIQHKAASSSPWNNPFRDVAQNTWYYEAVAYVHQNQLFSGTSASAFSPHAPATRSQIVTILYNLAGNPAVRSGNTFRDVPAGAYYTNAVEWAAAQGLTRGTGGGLFRPDAPVTREQLAVFLFQYAKQQGLDPAGASSLQRFSDCRAVSSYAVQPLDWAVSQGLLSGFEDGSLRPKSPATRAQTASIFRQFFHLLSSF